MSSVATVGDFGDLRGGDAGRRGHCAGISNSTRGIFVDQYPSPNRTDTSNSPFTIQSNGNSVGDNIFQRFHILVVVDQWHHQLEVLCIGFVSFKS